MDRLESMSILLAVVEAGGISAAARRLDMPVATVSRRVSDLEAKLKARLLSRSTRRLTLTDVGHAYVAACKRILEDVAEAERAASGEYSAPKGQLVITAPIVFGRLHVLPVAIEFLKTFPEIDARIALMDRLIDILDSRVDVAVRIGTLPDSSLMARQVGTVRTVACASPDYLATRGIPNEPGALGVHDCITFDGLMPWDVWNFGKRNVGESVSIHSRIVVNTAEAAVDAAIAGMGITRVLSYQVASAVGSRKLVVVLPEFEPAPCPVSLVYSGQEYLPQKIRSFLEFSAPRLKSRLRHRDV